MPAIGFEIKRKCKVCGEVFLAKTLDSQCCSQKCSKVAWKRKKEAKEKNEKQDRLAQYIPDIREYMSVKEAVVVLSIVKVGVTKMRIRTSGNFNSKQSINLQNAEDN